MLGSFGARHVAIASLRRVFIRYLALTVVHLLGNACSHCGRAPPAPLGANGLAVRVGSRVRGCVRPMNRGIVPLRRHLPEVTLGGMGWNRLSGHRTAGWRSGDGRTRAGGGK